MNSSPRPFLGETDEPSKSIPPTPLPSCAFSSLLVLATYLSYYTSFGNIVLTTACPFFCVCVRVFGSRVYDGQSDAFDGEYEVRKGGGAAVIVSPTQPLQPNLSVSVFVPLHLDRPIPFPSQAKERYNTSIIY